LAKSRQPTKDRRAHELSAKGAERKRPAGERMWRRAAVRANAGRGERGERGEGGKMVRVRLNSVRAESR
jgi:hypothetical protein